MSIHPSVTIHSTVEVDVGASIGSESSIWHWVHVRSGAIMGNGCSFGQNVFVGNKVSIGNNIKVQNRVGGAAGLWLE